MVRWAAFHRGLLTHRQPAGAGPGSGGPELHLHGQVDGLHVLGRAPYRGLGGGAGALRGGGGGGGGGAGAAGGPRCFALVDAAQREDGGHPHQGGSGSGKENKAGSSTPRRHRPNAFSELDNATPRLMLRRIIQNQPQVSPLALQTVQCEEREDARSEPPSQRTSSTVELQLPDLAPDDTSVTTFQVTRKRKKLSVSEFERAADKRLPQNQAHSTLDSTLARSLRMSVGSVIAPDTVEKRGLLRRPQNRRAIDIVAFEGGVEQNMLQRKEDYLVDSQTTSMIGTTTMRTDAEVVLNNTELFVEPQFDERNHFPLEPQLSDSKTSAQRSNASYPARGEARQEGLVSGVSTDGGRTQRFSVKDVIADGEHVDGITQKTPAKQGEEEQDHSQQNDPMEQFSESEEMVGKHHVDAEYSERSEKKLSRKAESQLTMAQDGGAEMEMTPSEEEGEAEGTEHQDSPKTELEMAGSVRAGSLGGHSPASYSFEIPGAKPLKEAVEQTGETEHKTVAGELNAAEEESTDDESETEDQESEEVSMKTPMFVRAAAYSPRPVLSPPRPVKSAAPELPPQPARAKPVPKSSGAAQRKTREPEIASGLIKQIFKHYAKMPVTRDAYKVVEKCSERYFKQISSDLEAYSQHAGRKTVEMADVEVLMRRQGLVTDKMPLHVLVERHLPLEYRKLLIPIAVSGNKVIPCK
ncbi:centromere protein T isoform X2 [Numida meleagris]|uniref:centromere protein T isoform X2 n=1 Tax=Numida meleagris TaxID=8996 RepID=UPI000B3E280F|nr:centromere protein T isoform X2 [Numida meleagris]